jgi:DnaJ-class molecular chaperone
MMSAERFDDDELLFEDEQSDIEDDDEIKPYPCPTCGGTGVVAVRFEPSGLVNYERWCDACHGTGLENP